MKKLTIHNLIYTLDSYKDWHAAMLPEKTEYVESYLESRAGAKYPYAVLVGLQAILKEWCEGVVITRELVDEAAELFAEHFKFTGETWDRSKWDYIVDVHGGKLPIKICAVLEGTAVDTANVLMTVINTDPNCAWLPCGLETLLQQAWYPTTVCTRSHFIVSIIKKYFKDTVNDENQWLADYYLHDFAQRGVSGMEQAGMGGMAHLVNSKGTDTVMSMPYAINYYNAELEDLAYSVIATEHSIMSSLGKEGEFTMVRNLIKRFPNGILSVVSDTYNIENALKMYCTDLKSDIMGRNGKFVIRPDSPRYKGDTPAKQVLWIVTYLWEHGYQGLTNKKGYKALDPHIGVIYGDSLTEDEIADILQTLKEAGFSAENCVFGCGGYLLQKVNRDTQRFAFKASAQCRDGVWYEIYKEPMDTTKVSKKGRLKLIWEKLTGFHTVSADSAGDNLLVTIFENGVLLVDQNFADIRARAWPKQ